MVVELNGDSKADAKAPSATKSVSPGGSSPSAAPPALRSVDWWSASDKTGGLAVDVAEEHNASPLNGSGWTDVPRPGALLLNGSGGFADTGAPILDTGHQGLLVAARVRLDADGFRTAVSLDGKQASVFFLQYVADYKRFSFSFVNARAIANTAPQPQFGRWYHVTGTYSHSDKKLRVYVDGVLSGEVLADNPERPVGNLVIGRGKFQGKATDFWPGAIAAVHVYDRALTPEEVATLAAREPPQ